MVQKFIKMAEEEDIEALRLAALQTIRPRKDNKKLPIASVTTLRHQEKQPFCRHITNPNLIAIVPSDPKNDFETLKTSPLRNGDKNLNDKKFSPKKNQSIAGNIDEKSDNLSVGNEKFRSKKFDESEQNKNELKSTTEEITTSTESKNIKFDEDELDFEGDTVMLHDDDDSLDRLMDEMEQEFSQGTLTSTTATTNNIAAKTTKQNKINVVKSEQYKNNEPSLPAEKPSINVKTTVTKSQSTLPKRQSPNGYGNSPKRKSRSRSPSLPSQSRKKFSPVLPPPPQRRRSRSRSPRSRSPLAMRPRSSRSPYSLSPLPRRRRSLTPLRNRYSRSPPKASRSSVSIKYTTRDRSPYSSKIQYYQPASPSYCPRSTSDGSQSPIFFSPTSPSYSPWSPDRKSPTYQKGRNSPPKSRFSPSSSVAIKRRSNSPCSSGNHHHHHHHHHYRRSPSPLNSKRKTSPNLTMIRRRSVSPPTTTHHHSRRSPNSRKINATSSYYKRESSTSTRHPKVPRYTSPNRSDESTKSARNSDDNKSNRHVKKFAVKNNIIDRKNDHDKIQEQLDPKLEARRKKFESSICVTAAANKKICLKNSINEDEKMLEKKIKKNENSLLINDVDEIKTSSKILMDIHRRKKSNLNDQILFEKVPNEVKKEIVNSRLTLNKKKNVIITDNDKLQNIEETLTERLHNNKRRVRTRNKLYTEKISENKPQRSISDDEEPYLVVESEPDEEISTKIDKKISRKNKKKKESKRKREVLLSENRRQENDGEDEEEEVVVKSSKNDDDDDEVEIVVKSNHLNPTTTLSASTAATNQQQSRLSKPGVDLRAELSRRRAERFKGVINPMARIIQSAFEDVVANRKKFETRCAVQDKDLEQTTSSDIVFKAKGSRRVHVLDTPKTPPKSTQFSSYVYKNLEGSSADLSDDPDDDDDDDDDDIVDNDDISDDDNNTSNNRRKFSVNTANQRSRVLRTTTASSSSTTSGSGRSILRRSQV